jgi:serine/threonine-protein kinase
VHGDLGSLQSALARHVQGATDQAKFITLTTPAATRTGTTGAATGGTLLRATSPSQATTFGTTLAASSGTGPTDEMIEAARRTLASHIGPIAKIIVKKVLSANPSREKFAEMLADQASDGSNHDKLLADLRKALG